MTTGIPKRASWRLFIEKFSMKTRAITKKLDAEQTFLGQFYYLRGVTGLQTTRLEN